MCFLHCYHDIEAKRTTTKHHGKFGDYKVEIDQVECCKCGKITDKDYGWD